MIIVYTVGVLPLRLHMLSLSLFAPQVRVAYDPHS